METEKVRLLIIGSGPAGYTAAIYASRANLQPVLYAGLQPGGQLTTTTEVENFPGYPQGVDGNQLMEDLRQQAERFGTDLRQGVATKADLSQRPFKITIDDSKIIEAEALIIATGAAAKYLGLEDEKKYAVYLSQELRMAGFILDTEYTGRALKGQFKQADRLNAKFTAVLNSEDLNNNEVKIKNQKTGEEEVISLDALIYYLDEKCKDDEFDYLEDDCDCDDCNHDHSCGCGHCHE